MDAANIHVIINHIPVFGMIFAAGLFLMGILSKNVTLKVYGYAAFIIISLISVPTFLTGESAAEKILDYPNVSKEYIEMHEDASKIALISILITGAISIPGVILIKKDLKLNKVLIWSAAIISMIAVILLIRTGYYAGSIRKPENVQPVHFNINNK